MFSKKDIDTFDNKISELEDAAEVLTNEINKKTINEQKEIIKIIEEYVKEKGLIVYGGNAQNLAVKLIDPKGCFYDDDGVHDYDVYSFDPVNHAEELTEIIYKKGYKNIIASEAIHVETYSIKYYGVALCDLSYMPKYIFDNLPILSCDGFKIVNPYIAYIDFMRMFNDPLTSSSFRWDKNFNRFNIMQEYYPLVSKNISFESKSEELCKAIKDDIKRVAKKSDTLIFTGFKAYNKYAKLAKCKTIPIKYYTLVSTDYVKDCKDIINELKKKHKNITTQEHYPFFQFFDFSIDIRVEDEIVCKVYRNNNICVPFKTSKDIKIASFTYNLMWLMIEKFYYSIYNADCSSKPKDSELINRQYDDIIASMLFIKEKYLNDKKKSFLDDTLFEHFVVSKCSGVPLNPSDIKHNIRNYRGFKFEPSKRSPNRQVVFYTNISGRFISSDNNKLVK